jgi:type I restriction enzyme S subunit
MENESKFIPLKTLTNVITKGTTPTKEQGYTENGINFIRALSIDDKGILDESTFLKISEETNASLSRSILEEGDVLFSIAGVIGRVAIVEKKHLPANVNQALAIIRPDKERIDSMYISNILRSHEAQFYLGSRVVESVQANLSLSELGSFPVEELSISEQKSRNKLLAEIELLAKRTRQTSDTLFDLRNSMLPMLNSDE